MSKRKELKMVMELANAVHHLGMAIYLLGETMEEGYQHTYEVHIRYAKEAIARAEAVK